MFSISSGFSLYIFSGGGDRQFKLSVLFCWGNTPPRRISLEISFSVFFWGVGKMLIFSSRVSLSVFFVEGGGGKQVRISCTLLFFWGNTFPCSISSGVTLSVFFWGEDKKFQISSGFLTSNFSGRGWVHCSNFHTLGFSVGAINPLGCYLQGFQLLFLAGGAQ